VTVAASSGNKLLIMQGNSTLNTGTVTLGSSTAGTTSFLRLDSTSSLTASSIVLSPGAGNSNLRLTSTGAITIGGGAGSISRGAGPGTATLDVRANVGALGVSSVDVTNINIGVGTTNGTLTINSGQAYTVGTSLSLGNGTLVGDTQTGTLNLSGGTLSTTNFYFNVGAGQESSVFNLNSGTLSAAILSRATAGAAQAFNWNSGTISNVSTGNLIVRNENAGTVPNLLVSLAGTGTHTFDATSGRTITVAATATLQDKAGENGTLNKAGAGTLDILSVSTYTGATTVSEGTFKVSGTGSVNSSSGVSVSAGATFNNSSSVAFNKTLTLAEGAALTGTGVSGAEFTPTALTITANLSDGFTAFAFGATGFTKDGNLELTLSGITEGTYGLLTGSAIGGDFDTVSVAGSSLAAQGGGVFSGAVGGFEYTFTDSLNQLQVSAIPEPSTFALLAGALTLVAVVSRRRRSAKASAEIA
jgi:autotransporter-associated beta strand protein